MDRLTEAGQVAFRNVPLKLPLAGGARGTLGTHQAVLLVTEAAGDNDTPKNQVHSLRGNRMTVRKAPVSNLPLGTNPFQAVRREAADKRLWNHLALAVAPDYVVWRHLSESAQRVAAERFRGPSDRQCFSRLWWAAEIFRNGPDYGPVETACGNQDLIHTVLRLGLLDHRPTAQAVVRLLQDGKITTGREVNGLSVAINAAGATLIYDVLAPDEPRDPARLRDWIAEAETAPPVSRHDLPEGPDEDPVPEESLAALTDYFADLFETAPVRGRKSED
ncbi:hypothetical protein SGRIM128S_03199 [Streptomyces griseomycini]